jgi:hypothetical protein
MEVSVTLLPWDQRYQRLSSVSFPAPEDRQHIDVVDLVVGDQLLIAGEPFVVTECVPDGPIIRVEATAGVRTLTTEYLSIERVTVLYPRPQHNQEAFT